MRVPLIACLLVCMVSLFPSNPASAAPPDPHRIPPGAVGVKWFPGHYLRTNVPGYKDADLEAFLAHPATTGLLIQADWKDLEPKQGVYDFTGIDQLIERAARRGKVVQLKIQDRSFQGQSDGCVPAYMKDLGFLVPMYKKDKIKGYAIKWWDPRCMDHFLALYRELGRRYNTDMRFAGIAIGDGESALAVDRKANGYSAKEHKNQIIRMAREVKTFFPNTPVFTGFNWMDAASLREIAEALKDVGGSGFIHPDTVPGYKIGSATDLEIEYAQKGVPTFAQLQTAQANFKDSMTESQIFDWAVKTIGASWVSWNHYRPNRPDYVKQHVLPFLNTPQSRFPEKNTTCPPSFQPAIPPTPATVK